MGKRLVFDCSGGISGDMIVGALLALGADKSKLLEVLESLPVEGFKIKISVIEKGGTECTDFDVVLDDEHENHDHDMKYLHGHDEHEPVAIDENGYVDMGVDGESAAHHHHRGLREITEIIEGSRASTAAKELAVKIFGILAAAESKAHGIPVENVHFHEIGAVDSIADILAIAVCLDDLDIKDVYVGKINDGCGTIRTRHGILPVPVPAVKIIAEEYGLPLISTDVKGEMVTPTGAAVLAAIRSLDSLPEKHEIIKTGCGAGKRDYASRGYLKAMIV